MRKRKNNIFKIIIFILIVFLIYQFLFARKNNKTESFSGYTNVSTTYSSDWSIGSNVGNINETISSDTKIRDKYTSIKGNGKDVVTIMVYMCGADLESQYGMATSDLKEMANADLSSNINLIVYTGGCSDWKISGISNKYNQIFKVVGNEQIGYLNENAGSGAMVDPDTLTSFIEYGINNFEADRYELIFWDHGAGSVQGYGSDENYPRNGSMTLDLIDEALTNAGVKFDFIGFDACLMANTETALMLSEHADYLIASEESEPGIGWYYTDWLNSLSDNTSLSTVQIGKLIADSFVENCASSVPSQSATLSVVDLAELEYTLPSALSSFASSTSKLINTDYTSVAKARSGAREFADASLDLVDLIDLANNVGNEEANDLIKVLKSCIKYNNTSNNISNAYGLSIYFPYRATSYLNSILNTYDAIDMNEEYSDCIRSFGSYNVGGQVSSGGYSSAYDVLDSSSSYDYNEYYNYETQNSSDLLEDVLGSFISGIFVDDESYSSYYDYSYDSWFDRNISKDIAEYVVDNHFDGDLNFKDGKISLTNKQWSLIDSLLLNVYIDDGEGYIDLGSDAMYDIDEDGNLLEIDDMTWLAASIDGENYDVVPFYYLNTYIDGDLYVDTGRIPVLLNGKYANLIVNIDEEGIEVVGATFDYKEESSMVGKNISQLNSGDEIIFVCDYYSYDGKFSNTYELSDTLVVDDKLYLNDVYINEEKYLALYEIHDIYQQTYYSSIMN